VATLALDDAFDPLKSRISAEPGLETLFACR
jgi:hypothetical protein